ncbi:MAG TPA: tol-pal system-associated acyl-CoA thioesterase [Paracoccaceae bacterium]|nr:tol-pal system-associated acyl-CoA thioesterase [Paracoccaceae bacterium]
MIHRHFLRVYWEDTDAGGIVYFANYLKFAERARTEALLARGIRQTELRERVGIVFAVREVSARYLRSARLEDQLCVTTRVEAAGGARLVLRQDIWREETCLAETRVVLACLGRDGRPVRVPAEVRSALAPSG